MKSTKSEADQKAIDEWLAKGNKITVYPKFQRTANTDVKYAWGRKKKKNNQLT